MDGLIFFKAFMSFTTFYLKQVKFQILHSDGSNYPEQRWILKLWFYYVWEKKKKGQKRKAKTATYIWISLDFPCFKLNWVFLFFMYALLSTNQEDLRESLDMSFIRFDVIEKKYWSVLLHIFFLNKVPNLKTELFSSLKIV